MSVKAWPVALLRAEANPKVLESQLKDLVCTLANPRKAKAPRSKGDASQRAGNGVARCKAKPSSSRAEQLEDGPEEAVDVAQHIRNVADVEHNSDMAEAVVAVAARDARRQAGQTGF